MSGNILALGTAIVIGVSGRVFVETAPSALTATTQPTFAPHDVGPAELPVDTFAFDDDDFNDAVKVDL